MTRLLRALGSALTILFLVAPRVGHADPILTGDPQGLSLSGWTNEFGTFAFDFDLTHFDTTGPASYSTSSGLFSLSGHGVNIHGVNSSHGVYDPDASVQLNVIVTENGTTSGNLLAGILTVVAGINGAPEAGIAPGETLLTGYALEAAAINHAFDTAFLFALTYTHASFASLGDYVTYVGPHGAAWGTNQASLPFEPWGKDWGPRGGFTFDAFYATHKVNEPTTGLLFALLLGVLALFKRSFFSSSWN